MYLLFVQKIYASFSVKYVKYYLCTRDIADGEQNIKNNKQILCIVLSSSW